MDLAILHWIQNTLGCPFLDWLMPLMSAIGEHGMVWLAIAVVMLFMKKYRKWGFFMIASVFVCWVVGDQIVKPIIARPRPFYVDPTIHLIVDPPDGYSMPSGHTLAAFCAATVLMFSPLKKPGKVMAAIVAVLIAFSRLYLCVHNPTDVLAGMLLGIAFGLVGALLCRRWSLDLGELWRLRPARKAPGEPQRLLTTWGQGIVDDLAFPGRAESFVPLPEHPRPQFARESVTMLNGMWDYRIVKEEHAVNVWRSSAAPQQFDGQILVPFSPEAPLSGVGHQLQPDELLWYHRTFDSSELPEGERFILHFDAVDYACACYVNGSKAALHVGGYLPFEFDMTEALVEGENEIAVCVFDPSEHGTQPRGKQRLENGGIWYTAQSGIWQSVWIEGVPENFIVKADVEADLEHESIVIVPRVYEVGDRFTAIVRDADGRTVGRQSILVSFDRISTPEIRLHVPSPHVWSPEDPYLYQVELRYGDDRVRSYCAFRTVAVREGEDGVERFYLNGQPYFLRGVLDQGYWPDGLMTPPSDEALVSDVQTARDLGFNMIRMHVKVECERFYYHCDRLGVLVWQDMVSGGDIPNEWETAQRPVLFRHAWGNYDDATFEHCKKLGSGDEVYRKEWRDDALATVRRLKTHPCIMTWSLFNEGWGQFASIAALSLVRGADTSRPIDAASGWFDQGCGDWFSVHNYYRRLEVYKDHKGRDGEGGELATLSAHDLQVKRAFVLSEFGGVACHVPEHSLYGRAAGHDDMGSIAAWRTRVEELLTEAEKLELAGASGFVFTQLADVEGETNGILSYDRRVNKLGGVADEPLAVEGAREELAGADGDEPAEAADEGEAEAASDAEETMLLPVVTSDDDGREDAGADETPASEELEAETEGDEAEGDETSVEVPAATAEEDRAEESASERIEELDELPTVEPVVLDDSAFEPKTEGPEDEEAAGEEPADEAETQAEAEPDGAAASEATGADGEEQPDADGDAVDAGDEDADPDEDEEAKS